MKKIVLPLFITAVVFLVLFSQNNGGNFNISPSELKERIENDTTIVFLDVRTKEEFASSHIAGAILFPLQELENRIAELNNVKHKTLLIYCRSGRRSGIAAEILRKNGFTALNMTGGTIQWETKKFPLVTEPR